MYSQMSRPGTLVRIGRNSPRIPSGASGFRSNMSWCGGPPARKIMMTALCERRTPDWLSARSRPGSDRPPRASPPILRKSRRVTPSQYPVRAGPKRLNMPLALPSCPAEHPSLCRCLTRLCTPFPGLANPTARRSFFVNFVLVERYLSATSWCPAPTPLAGVLPNSSGFRRPPSLNEEWIPMELSSTGIGRDFPPSGIGADPERGRRGAA